jgi:hypothetical protein
LCRWLSKNYGLDAQIFTEHVYWADIIDAARFASPAQAVELREPALKLMALLEANPPNELVEQMIVGLSRKGIEEVYADPLLQTALAPILQGHQRSIEVFRSHMAIQDQVAYFDLTADGLSGFNKFIPYYLSPDIRYTVGLTWSSNRSKVSVGSNPWNRPEPLVNLADLCQRYGGGGHPVVGAVTLPSNELDKARQVALEIVHVLRQSGQSQ